MNTPMHTLLNLIHAFGELKVGVIGEAMLDSYLQGSSDRLCPEAPVPVVKLHDRQDVPGGAANTAVNVGSLGAKSQLISVIGQDAEGLLLQQALEQRGVSTAHLFVHPARQTLTKHRVLAGTQMVVRFDQGSTEPVDLETEQWLIDRLSQAFAACDAIIVSDYGYGILTPRVIQTLAALQAASPQVLVVDARDLTAYCSVGVTAVKPNYTEVVKLLNLPKLEGLSGRSTQIQAQQAQLLEVTGAQIVAVTLDAEGALCFQQGYPPYQTDAQPQPSSQTSGAGDTFVSALTLALARDAPTSTAADLAAAAAAIVVAKEGTSACSATELQRYLVTSRSSS